MRYYNGSVEEPIYMPHTARPISPVASYQPGQFPYEAYYGHQQYATIDKSNKYRKNKPPPSQNSKSKNSSKNPSSDSNADDSEFGAGLYKKGHINERAFSYSIRNEQRSRSYGSLANANSGHEGDGGPPGENGGPSNGDGQTDLAHMMSDIELADDHIERREVPPGLYNPDAMMAAAAAAAAAGGQNGIGHYGNGGPHPPHLMAPHPPHLNVNGKKKR